jgi:hypothetical protein
LAFLGCTIERESIVPPKGRSICDRDMEGIVAKQASARYTPEATTWVKIKNRQYSQAVGREDFFDHRRVTK